MTDQRRCQMKFRLDELLAAVALLIGRRTYEGFSEAWPGRSGEFADKMNDAVIDGEIVGR